MTTQPGNARHVDTAGKTRGMMVQPESTHCDKWQAEGNEPMGHDEVRHMIIEQTSRYPMRMQYDPHTRTFSATEYQDLGHARGVVSAYGWLEGCGTPPGHHLDIFLSTDTPERFELGQPVAVRVIGVFVRNDGDDKLVGVEIDRPERRFEELPESERQNLMRMYPRIDPGEGWFSVERAEAVIAAFRQNGRRAAADARQ